MATSSPRATDRSMLASTSVRAAPRPYPLPTPRSARNATSGRLQPMLDGAHHLVEDEADDADGQDAQDDVLVDQAVVFLPEEAADAGRPGQHLDGDDHQPRDPQAETEPGEYVRQRGRQ